ncbi:MAG: methionyl-tRNA formyltransferase [Alphaproteobacteria bacterium]|nr:methionyl-tRNA formyltransferase [Alphaproteobacteria bacterium]MBM3950535.1 methionyl-tRNA formyltransferase [Rhodospirillales bacterium]
MRILFNGQQAFGKAVLEALVNRGEEIVGVYCAPDKPGKKMDPLKEYALSKNLRVFQPASFKDPAVWEQMKSLNAELGVMAYVLLLVPEEALAIPTHGTIQYHPSLLPWHKGPSSINWPIIMGKKETGLSVFWPDNGLDTGPILLQKKTKISDKDTLGSIYFDRLFPMGVAAMLEAIDLVKAKKAPRIPQAPKAGSYEGWCNKEVAKINWKKPAADVYNLIRGTNPQPGAWTTFKGKTLDIYDCVKVAKRAGKPGQIVAVGKDSFTVAAKGGQIKVLRVRPEGGQKISAGQFAAETGLGKGAKLG